MEAKQSEELCEARAIEHVRVLAHEIDGRQEKATEQDAVEILMYESLRFAYGLLEVLIFVTSITIWNKGIISQIILSFPIAVFTGRNMFAERSKKGISDNKIYHYHLNIGGSVSTRRLTRLPSIPKNDAKFRIYIQ